MLIFFTLFSSRTFTNFALLLCNSLSNALCIILNVVEILENWDALYSEPISPSCSLLCRFWFWLFVGEFQLVCPMHFVECPIGERLKYTVLNAAIPTLQGQVSYVWLFGYHFCHLLTFYSTQRVFGQICRFCNM